MNARVRVYLYVYVLLERWQYNMSWGSLPKELKPLKYLNPLLLD